MILRKRTLPERTNIAKQLPQHVAKAHSAEWSDNYLKQNIGKIVQTTPKIQLIKITEISEKSCVSTPKSNQSITEQVEKQINKNKLTLNLTGQITPSYQQLPSICSFKKMKNMLVDSPLYQKYSEISEKRGEAHSLLAKLQHQYDMAAAKIKVNRHSKNIIRNSRFLINGSSITFGQTIAQKKSPLKQTFSHLNAIKSHKLFGQKIRQPAYRQAANSAKDGWKLKDFYSHIGNQQQCDDLQERKVKERQDIISKLKKINEECQVLQNNNSQITKYIDVFAKYNENLSQKLSKKHRKINKVYYSQHY